MPLSDLWSNQAPDNADADAGDFFEDADAIDSANPSACEGADQENLKLRRKLQTGPAREALAVKRARQVPIAKTEAEPIADTYAERLQKRFFTHSYQRGGYQKKTCADDTPDEKRQFGRERSRCVWSFLQSLKAALVNLFQERGSCEHALNTIVADDTSTTLKAIGSGRNVVHTVMNTVQALRFRYSDGDFQCLHIPTPMRCLTSGKAEAIHAAFSSWLVLTASGLGTIWKHLDCPDKMPWRAKWKTTLLMGDALRANDKAWRCECRARAKTNDPFSCGLRFRCSNHQLCLVRKPTVLSVERMWSTVVRLGHLYETQSFRRSLAAAFVKLLQKDGQFTRSWMNFSIIFHFSLF